ncbi:MAG TPA: hypothetical protein VHE99_12350 [Gammaproteobacteria bacterium]|nr:hypothetical protein [Gammaproteobacteria bacterium]
MSGLMEKKQETSSVLSKLEKLKAQRFYLQTFIETGNSQEKIDNTVLKTGQVFYHALEEGGVKKKAVSLDTAIDVLKVMDYLKQDPAGDPFKLVAKSKSDAQYLFHETTQCGVQLTPTGDILLKLGGAITPSVKEGMEVMDEKYKSSSLLPQSDIWEIRYQRFIGQAKRLGMENISVPELVVLDGVNTDADEFTRFISPLSEVRAKLMEEPELQNQFDTEVLTSEQEIFKQAVDRLRRSSHHPVLFDDKGVGKIPTLSKQFHDCLSAEIRQLDTQIALLEKTEAMMAKEKAHTQAIAREKEIAKQDTLIFKLGDTIKEARDTAVKFQVLDSAEPVLTDAGKTTKGGEIVLVLKEGNKEQWKAVVENLKMKFALPEQEASVSQLDLLRSHGFSMNITEARDGCKISISGPAVTKKTIEAIRTSVEISNEIQEKVTASLAETLQNAKKEGVIRLSTSPVSFNSSQSKLIISVSGGGQEQVRKIVQQMKDCGIVGVNIRFNQSQRGFKIELEGAGVGPALATDINLMLKKMELAAEADKPKFYDKPMKLFSSFFRSHLPDTFRDMSKRDPAADLPPPYSEQSEDSCKPG